MRYLSNNATYIFVIIGSLILSAGIYYTNLVFSDSRYIEKNSIEYLLLVPSILKELPLKPTDQVRNYYYSSADGNKPAVVSVEFTTPKYSGETHTKILNYFDELGFKHNNNLYKKKNMEVSITHSTREGNTILVNVAIFEYL